jgi:hypothetical protein
MCGAANNQLLENRDGSTLASRAIPYVPDYVANAGGIINGAQSLCNGSLVRCTPAVEALYERTPEVLELAQAQGISTSRARIGALSRLPRGKLSFHGSGGDSAHRSPFLWPRIFHASSACWTRSRL